MDEGFDQNTRSAADLAILRAFETMDLGNMEGSPLPLPANTSLPLPANTKGNLPADIVQPPLIPLEPVLPATAPPAQQETDAGHNELRLYIENEMLVIFVSEVDEDIRAIRHILRHIEPFAPHSLPLSTKKAHEQEEWLDPGPLQTIQRLAHKIKGTSGSIGCMTMSTIAFDIEELAKMVVQGELVSSIGLHALAQSISALEMTLNSMITYGTEPKQPLADLEAEYRALNIDIQGTREGYSYHGPTRPQSRSVHGRSIPRGYPGAAEYTERAAEHTVAPSSVRVDVRRFEQLVLHTEELAEAQTPMQHAQTEVEQALQELHAAQARLRHVEALVATNLFARDSNGLRQSAGNERPTSSLVARILDEVVQRTGHLYQRSLSLPANNTSKYAPPKLRSGGLFSWDALEMDSFTESDVLISSLNEAIADVATATAQLRLALTHLNYITQEHMVRATQVRNDTLLLCLTPLSSLVARIERAVAMSTVAQGRQVQFETEGSATEIDQDILEELKQPLLQLVRTCLAQSYREPLQQVDQSSAPLLHSLAANNVREQDERIWLHVHAFGNQVVLELGFSMTVGGGALDGLQEVLHRLNGSVMVQKNTYSGITFVLRLPRTQGAVRCLLVRVGGHRVVVPFTQVQRIDEELPARPPGAAPQFEQSKEGRYSLHTLLGFPPERNSARLRQPVLLVSSNSTPLAVQVDEILGDVELVVKPLAPHLQRPGIVGTVIDGMRNVLLVVDIAELVRHHARHRPDSRTGTAASRQKMYEEQVPLTVMVADDSVYIRQSVRYTLTRAGYRVVEAEDGMKALELLVDQPPDALVLDMEMPNLNGYDVLSMMRVHPELANVKVVMLTSRSSEKYQARARELGVHSYLTKPCPEDMLLSALHKLLTS